MKANNNLQFSIIGTLLIRPDLYNDFQPIPAFIFSGPCLDAFELFLSEYDTNGKINLSTFEQKITGHIKDFTNRIDVVNFEANLNELKDIYLRIETGNILSKAITALNNGDDYIDTMAMVEKENGIIDEIFSKEANAKDDDLMAALKLPEIANASTSTGYYDLDEKIGGWIPGTLNMVAARPSMGKTTVMIDLAMESAQQRIPTAICSLEMPKKILYGFIAARIAKIDKAKIFTAMQGSDGEKYADALGQLEEIPIFIFDSSDFGSTWANMKAFIRKMIKIHGIKNFFLDYLQKIKTPGQNRNLQIEEITDDMQTFAIISQTAFIILSQLSRAVEARGGSKRPQLSDLRDSGAIEQAMDVIIMLYRAEYYGIEEMQDEDDHQISTKGLMEMLIVKNRILGRLGSLKRRYNANENSYKIDGLAPLPVSDSQLITTGNGIGPDEDIPF